MSTTVVFLPGIMGTRLALPSGEEVWPPEVQETILGYDRIDKLLNPAVRPTRIIENISCFDFYKPILLLLRDLGFKEKDGGGKRLVPHPYDWRRDLFDLAEGLAARLDTIDSDQIVIVAHSMGGLVSRLVLETGTWRDRPWFNKIAMFIAIATPHNGAPLALARVMGLDEALGISAADFKRFCGNVAYPSGYQLLPAPGEDALWDTSPGARIAPMDYYDPQVAMKVGLNPALVDRAKALHDALGQGSAPGHVRYFYFGGTGHKTATRVNLNGNDTHVVFTADAGDGTVPLWSALPRSEQKQVVVNEHGEVFRGNPFKRVFFQLFGGNAGQPKEAQEGPDLLQVSLQKPVFNAKEPIEAILIPDAPISTLAGRLVFDRIDENDQALQSSMVAHDIHYTGPEIQTLALTIRADLMPGIYELRYEGDHPQAARVVFTVSKS